ncbi:MAG: S-layer homology domain-containing protein [Clostridia bacterium]|nr:S-layer homology domain-containing protein [Clostridia bacterium]
MCKKIVSLLLAVMLLASFGMTAMAANYSDNAETSASLQIAPTGTPIIPTTGDTAQVSKTSSEAFPTFDYLCTLNMQNVRDKFDSYYTNWVSLLSYIGDPARIAALNLELESMQVTGEFVVEITYPNTMTLPAEFLVNNQMAGFDNNAKLIFGNDTRTVIPGATNNTLKIEVEVVGADNMGSRPGYILAKDLKDHIDTYLSNFTLSLPGVSVADYGTYTVSGKLTGFTLATGPSVTLRVDYTTNPEWASATATITEISGNRVAPTTPVDGLEYTLTFDVDGNKTLVAPIKAAAGTEIALKDLKIPYQDGYAFAGWYFDANCARKVTEGFTLDKNMTLYGSFRRTTSSVHLNTDDHWAYIIGYPEGDVKPESNITREEIATIFFRLLKDHIRTDLFHDVNHFTDIEEDRWSNNAISTLVNGGFLKGYEDGSFRPEAPITRAEFAAIASRLDTMIETATHSFSDLDGHWAEKYIANAVEKGWITGYEDGTFRPEAPITRAETMTIINRMLNRFIKHGSLHADAIDWPDNPEDAWYYFAVQEATNSHDYNKHDDGIYETWPSLRENRDWASLEQ